MSGNRGNQCDWCGVGIEEGDGYRLLEPGRSLGAAFCRLEHVVPWMMKKNQWHIWRDVRVPKDADPHCDRAGEELGEGALYLVRHRGQYRIADGFCDRETLLKWATAGGRYG